ncbi:hypothetical protein LWI28_009414 [Acer negundo]|uniref:Uncharacterized protein n=1 Tax=Acer negundo TaxID=4023 RepID=A0AAD5II16_ACENE|nr:hypothetical protein LWI28_009414 [Acer negundo]
MKRDGNFFCPCSWGGGGVDLTLCEKKPSKLTAESTAHERSHRKRWTESNQKCLMFLQLSISKTIKKSIPKCNDARTFLKAVSRKFKKQSKAERGKYLNLLTTTVMMVLESLPGEFDVLKTSCNTQQAEWTMDQMTAIVV